VTHPLGNIYSSSAKPIARSSISGQLLVMKRTHPPGATTVDQLDNTGTAILPFEELLDNCYFEGPSSERPSHVRVGQHVLPPGCDTEVD
jgi:hypothetical protein